MHKLIAIGMLAVATPAFAQFEGVIEMKMKGGDDKHSVEGKSTMYLGKPGMRVQMHMEMPGGGGMDMVSLLRFKEPTLVYQLNEGQKTYSVIDTKKLGSQEGRQARYTVKKLGKEKVAGFTCEHLKVTDEQGSEFELWTTKEIADADGWQKMMSGQGGAAHDSEGMLAALKKEGADGFVAKLAGKDKSGGQGSMTMEVVKVEKKALPASMFEVPAGYTKSDGRSGGMTLSPEAQKAMEEQMKNMTPEQRDMIKKAMQQQGGH